MRADMSIFIFIIVAVVLAGAVLVMGMGGIGQVGSGMEDFLGLGEKVESQFTPQDIKSLCQSWLASESSMNDPEKVANLGVADSFKPFPRFWDECGEPLAALVTVCKSGSEDCPDGIISTATAYSYNLGGDFGTARGRDTVDCCVRSCGIAIRVYQQCELTANSEAERVMCFTDAMNEEVPRCG